MNDAIPPGVPFVLSCTSCDVDSPESHEQALREGWSHIQYFPEGLSENFIGLCPVCRREEDEEAARLRAASEDN